MAGVIILLVIIVCFWFLFALFGANPIDEEREEEWVKRELKRRQDNEHKIDPKDVI